ncbi:unnamed protein product [Colias eurytheme]|nr:unnamed protein product [Colias eurytheme]
MSSVSKRRKEGTRAKIKSMGDHREFLKRISKTLYYGQLPTLPCLSLPVTEISCEVWSLAQRGRSVRRLHADRAAAIARSACVSPCALVLAILYLERLKRCNPNYLAATPPADLFLVSLMVSNKFLQDDGEEDEVICSEWAASGGLDLQQLKKLEAEFLNAIDWNVYISEKSFESGLSWLERQVAMKQGHLRGYFTYSDLVASYDPALLRELLRSVSAACFALTLSYVTGFMTLVTSTLVVSHAWLPTLQYIAARAALSTALDTSTRTQPQLLTNTTIDLNADFIPEDSINIDALKCCEKWQKYQDNLQDKKTWYNGARADDLKLFESWWSKTSVLNWLYQSSLINPMQRWLEKINEYTDFIKNRLESDKTNDRCNGFMRMTDRQHCIQQRLNFSKLSIFAASVSDR